LQAPARQIAANAGAEASIVAGKILDNKDATFGYNAQTGDHGDMIAMGIVDPVKVVRTAQQDAASVGGLLVTTEAMIAEVCADSHRTLAGQRNGLDKACRFELVAKRQALGLAIIIRSSSPSPRSP